MLIANYKFKKDLKAAIGEKLLFTDTYLYRKELSCGDYYVVGPSVDVRKWSAVVRIEMV